MQVRIGGGYAALINVSPTEITAITTQLFDDSCSDHTGVVRVTNFDTGEWITLSGGVRQDLIFRADGTIDVWINGTVLAAAGVPDLGGPSMWWFRGHLHDVLDATFTRTAHSFTGNATDICAALS